MNSDLPIDDDDTPSGLSYLLFFFCSAVAKIIIGKLTKPSLFVGKNFYFVWGHPHFFWYSEKLKMFQITKRDTKTSLIAATSLFVCFWKSVFAATHFLLVKYHSRCTPIRPDVRANLPRFPSQSSTSSCWRNCNTRDSRMPPRDNRL